MNPSPSIDRRGNRGKHEQNGVGGFARAIHSMIALGVAGFFVVLAAADIAAGQYVDSISERMASPRYSERPRLDAAREHHAAAASYEIDVSNKVPPEIAILIKAHEAVRGVGVGEPATCAVEVSSFKQTSSSRR